MDIDNSAFPLKTICPLRQTEQATAMHNRFEPEHLYRPYAGIVSYRGIPLTATIYVPLFTKKCHLYRSLVPLWAYEERSVFFRAHRHQTSFDGIPLMRLSVEMVNKIAGTFACWQRRMV